MATRVTSTRLIGRTGELAELEAAFSAAADGHPSIAFVAAFFLVFWLRGRSRGGES